MLIGVLGWCMQSLADTDGTLERERIVLERAWVRADFAARERECQARFAVTRCVDTARSQQREALGRLRREELRLDDARRKQRAAERVAGIRSRISADEARERKALAAPVSASASTSASAATSGPKSAPRASRVASRKASPRATDPVATRAAAQRRDDTTRRAREARNAAEFEARRKAARAHRAEIERRNTERAAHGKKAAQPLAGTSVP
ncbi:MAG: hypothetical protein ABIN44_10260 [Burkholderiaceae bacterium]